MRLVAGIALTSLTAAAVAAVSAVSVTGAGSDGLSDTSLMKDADFTSAFAGTGRVPDDPDAPIRTSRFDDTPIPAAGPALELAGAPGRSPSGPPVVQLASADASPAPDAQAAIHARVMPPAEPPAPPTYAEPRVAAFARPAVRQAMMSGGVPRGLFNPVRRVSLSLTSESPFNPGSGLTFAAREPRQDLAQPIPPRNRLFDARRLGIQVDVTPSRNKKGRWFAFAATSGDAFGFNFGEKGRKASQRWSVEKLAEYGKVQVGLGWRKGPMQISAAATQREIGAYGYSRDDTVFGLSFTVSGGKRLPAPKARRGIPRGD
ncbi:MAG: hypothetical protein Q7T61_02225 [Caulobacter sp.]|nr:hypothetical protein [Caulobacter sp.]